MLSFCLRDIWPAKTLQLKLIPKSFIFSVLTGYDGRFSWWGSDGYRDVDGVAVEGSLACPGGVLLVVSILLLLSKTQAAPHCFQWTGGEAIFLSIWLPLPGERNAHLITDIIIL